jgi:hypothetical protein
MTLGTAPVNESCAQLGQEDYEVKVRPECQRFIKLLRFGVYYEVVCLFNADDEEAEYYAFRCEDELPATWED